MKILQIISGRNVNGAVLYCKLLSEQLAARGHEVTILARKGCCLSEYFTSESFNGESNIRYEESDLNRFPPGQLRTYARRIADENFDLIHTHMSRANTFGILLKMMTGVPVIATAHANHFHPHWQVCNQVIANSQATYEYQKRINRIPAHKLSMVHCFTNLERVHNVTDRSVHVVRRQLRLKGDEFLVGVVGEVVKRKGHLTLFRAMKEIVQHVPNFKLVILGRFHRDETYVRQLRSLLIQEGLFRRTKWLGLRDNVEDFMAAFDLCVVPSNVEPLGLVAIEALAAGTAVVATEVGGLPEVVDHGESGLLVPARDPERLAKSIVKLAQDDDLRELCGQLGKVRMFERFSPERLTSQVEQVYFRVLKVRAVA